MLDVVNASNSSLWLPYPGLYLLCTVMTCACAQTKAIKTVIVCVSSIQQVLKSIL